MLIVSDLHLDDTAITGYRFKIFSKLQQKIQEHNIKNVIILGDILDKKDKHPSYLVNRITDELNFLTELGTKIIILMGNHDYVTPDEPFLKFLNWMPNIKFISEPKVFEIEDKNCLFLPHTHQPELTWKIVNFTECYDMIFTHQDFKGAEVHEFYSMEKGLTEKHPLFTHRTSIYSGHIHKPQNLYDNRVTYIGSPYHVNFGDNYEGRIIIPSVGSFKLDLPKKHKIIIYDNNFSESIPKIKEFDQYKIIIRLPLSKANLYEKWCNELKEYFKNYYITIIVTELELISEDFYTQEQEKQKISSSSEASIIKEFGVKEKLHSDYINVALDITKDIQL